MALYHTALSPTQSVPAPLVLLDCPVTEQKLVVTKPTMTKFGSKTNQLLTPRPHLSFSWKLQFRQLVGQNKETSRLEHEDRWQHPPPLGTGVEGGNPKSGCSRAFLLQTEYRKNTQSTQHISTVPFPLRETLHQKRRSCQRLN